MVNSNIQKRGMVVCYIKKSIARIFTDRPEKWQKTTILKSGMPGENDKEIINISISWIETIHEMLRG